MEVELLEVRDFLAQQNPFDLLTSEQLNSLPEQMAIRYLRRGNPFPPVEVEKDCLYIIRQGAVDMRGGEQELIDKLAEGDVYAIPCQEQELDELWHGSTSEDSLIYLLPCDVVQQLCAANPAFAEQLQTSARARLRSALSHLYQIPQGDYRLNQTPVADLLRRGPVTTGPDTTIHDAARIMTEQRVSALMIVEQDRLTGIVTDRDLRSRCLATDLPVTQSVARIMSRQLTTLEHDATVFDAMLMMTYLNIHHLPIVNGGHLLGLITHDDILHVEQRHAVYLAAGIERAEDIESLAQIAERLPELQARLMEQQHSAEQLGLILSTIVDALTRRLLELGEAKLGAAPIEYCWIVMGSLARQEINVGSDQDNALVLGENYDDTRHSEYFRQLSEFVCQGLAQCGFRLCPGEMMASNPRWRNTVSQWQNIFRDWFRHPGEQEVMLACNFLDLRAVTGRTDLMAPLLTVQHEAQQQQGFIAALARNALNHRPPLGVFRNLVVSEDEQHHPQLDLKAGGLMPIVSLARFHATEAGIEAVNTAARLQASKDASQLSREGARDLLDAYAFMNTLRAHHQAERIRNGQAVDSILDPTTLSGLERRHLKDAFGIVRKQQLALRRRFDISGTL